MTQIQPPPGMVSRKTAVRLLTREKVITSTSMIMKLKGLDRIVPEGRSHGFYRQDQLLKIINNRRELYGLPPLPVLFNEKLSMVFRQATDEDMPGVYEVAHKLFGHTTPASTRIELLRGCPEGNVLVTDFDQIVSFAHIYPLQHEPLVQFLNGKFRGNGIAAEHLDPFAPGKVVDILIKSMGSYHEHLPTSRTYGVRLLKGLKGEVAKWGEKGYIINKIYGTSETPSGIALALEFRMQSLGKIPGSKGKKRYAFELDPYRAKHHVIRSYAQAIEAWKDDHPQEWEEAWEKWETQHS